MKCQVVKGDKEVHITDIFTDSREIKPGSLFICTSGERFKGRNFVSEAVSKGAAAILMTKSDWIYLSEQSALHQQEIDAKAPTKSGPERAAVIVCHVNPVEIISELAARFYNNPESKLKLIGITGTKGKTTTAFMVHKVISDCGKKCGLIGTVHIDDGINITESSQTTPSAIDTIKILSRMIDNGCEFAVMEISSQAMKKHRVDALHFDISAITNISCDHIGAGEHASFDEYVKCKAALLEKSEFAFVNGDDLLVREIADKSSCPHKTYGFDEKNDFRIYEYDAVRLRNGLCVEYDLCEVPYIVPMAGRFSAMNGALAALICRRCEIDKEKIRDSLRKIKVPGRCQVLPRKDNRLVIIDYAHNGLSMESLLDALSEYRPRKITCIFGCGGNRSKERRKNMAEAVSYGADRAIITSDNPRSESPLKIISEIEANMQKLDTKIIPDRAMAIKYGIESQEYGEILVVSGKGHEKYQIIGDETFEFDDVLTAEKIIELTDNRGGL